MPTEPSEPSEPAAAAPTDLQAARLRPCWLGTLALQPGMVLARPVSASSGGYATMHLRAGITLTEETIAQMLVKGIDCVAVHNTSPMDEGAYALAHAAYAERLGQIFGATPEAPCQSLLDALLRRGPLPC